jgi:hypothetical protein
VDGDVSSHARRGRSARIGSHTARNAPVAGTRSRGADHPALPSHLAPKRQRRAYGDKGLAHRRDEVDGAGLPLPRWARTSSSAAMLRSHVLDWASTQRDNCRTYLLSPTGRFQQWCTAAAISTVDGLTTEAVAPRSGPLPAVAIDRTLGA